MACTWREELASRYADGSLAPGEARAYTRHLAECEVCRGRVAAAERLEGLLRAAIAPVAPPPTLAAKVAQAVAVERESRRARFAWPSLLRRRTLLTALASLALALGLVVVAGGAESVRAVVQRALLWVPGVGISAVDESNLVAASPVVVSDGGVTFTVATLLSDGKQTTLRFSVAGLPGGKRGWEQETRPSPRPPFLRDERGNEYAVMGSWHGTGGSPDESHIDGGMSFAPLPGDLRSVDLVVPSDYLVPPAVLPGAEAKEWVARIPLVRPAESDLPPAVAQDAATTVGGITLRAVASSASPERTVVLVEGQAPGEARVSGLIPNGGDPETAITLRDDRGRTYKHVPEASDVSFGQAELHKSLSFEPLAADARDLTLTVAAVQVIEAGEAEVTVSLADRKLGEPFALDRTVRLGDHTVLLRSAWLAEDPDGRPWLYLEVDLGPTVAGRTLSTFSVDEPRRAWGTSMGAKDGAQVSEFGVAIEPDQREVRLRLSRPLVIVEGPWELTFPVRGQPIQ